MLLLPFSAKPEANPIITVHRDVAWVTGRNIKKYRHGRGSIGVLVGIAITAGVVGLLVPGLRQHEPSASGIDWRSQRLTEVATIEDQQAPRSPRLGGADFYGDGRVRKALNLRA